MTKQLYDYWFVQFDFPNEEGKPYKSSGGAMKWSNELNTFIPSDWNAVKMADVLDKYPTTRKLDTKEYLERGLYPVIDQGDKYIVGYTNTQADVLDRFPAVLFGDHSTKVKFLNFGFARGADGTQILYSKNPNIKPYYLYCAVLNLNIPNTGYSRHFKYLKELYIIEPSNAIAKAFQEIVEPNYMAWTNNVFANVELQRQRDELLPLLMSGQVSVTQLNYHLSVFFTACGL